MAARGVFCARGGEGKREGQGAWGELRGPQDGRTDGRTLLFVGFFCQSHNSQIYFVCDEQMAPGHRTQATLPAHAMRTADIDGEAL